MELEQLVVLVELVGPVELVVLVGPVELVVLVGSAELEETGLVQLKTKKYNIVRLSNFPQFRHTLT